MALRVTARPGLGPLRFNTGTRGLTSVTLKLGPVSWRLWSRTGRAGLSSVDLPGPVSYRPPRRRLNATERAIRHARITRRRGWLAALDVAALIAGAVLGWPGEALVAFAVGAVLFAATYVRLRRRLAAGVRAGAGR
jgi:hypothetical protein